MSVSQISPSSLTSTNAYVNPAAKTMEPQSSAIQQGNLEAQKQVKTAQTDTVTISQQALEKVPDGMGRKPEEARNSTSNQQSGSFSTQA